jgi:hypothetical protein
MHGNSSFKGKMDRKTLQEFSWRELTREVRQSMPITSAAICATLPSCEKMRLLFHRGRHGEFRRNLHVGEAEERLARRESLLYHIILYSNFPKTHTLIAQLFSTELFTGHATQKVFTVTLL